MCNALAVSLRTEVGTASPYLAVVTPLEQDISDNLMFGLLSGADLKSHDRLRQLTRSHTDG